MLENELDISKLFRDYVAQFKRTNTIMIKGEQLTDNLLIVDINLSETEVLLVEVQAQGKKIVRTRD